MMEHAEKAGVKIRIGVNFGKVVLALMGSHKLQFSLIGDVVNTTKLICSSSEVGKIAISSNVYPQLKDSDLIFDMRRVCVIFLKF